MKAGLIRCMQTEDMCPGTTNFKVIREKNCAFEGIEVRLKLSVLPHAAVVHAKKP